MTATIVYQQDVELFWTAASGFQGPISIIIPNSSIYLVKATALIRSSTNVCGAQEAWVICLRDSSGTTTLPTSSGAANGGAIEDQRESGIGSGGTNVAIAFSNGTNNVQVYGNAASAFTGSMMLWVEAYELTP